MSGQKDFESGICRGPSAYHHIVYKIGEEGLAVYRPTADNGFPGEEVFSASLAQLETDLTGDSHAVRVLQDGEKFNMRNGSGIIESYVHVDNNESHRIVKKTSKG